MHVDPFLGRRLRERPDAFADRVLKDLSSATGNRLEAGVAQARNHVPHRPLRDLLQKVDLRRGESVEVDRRKVLSDESKHVLVKRERQGRVHASLEKKAGAAEIERLLELFAYT